MSDSVRLHAYQAALEQVCPGQVVCDLNAGLGLYSLMALRAGAERVYAIENDREILELAMRIMLRNDIAPDRFIALDGPSTDVELPEPAGVIVADVLADAELGRNVAGLLEDARARLAAPDAVFVPTELTLYAALTRPRAFKGACEFWDADLFVKHGIDFGDVVPELREHAHILMLRDDEIVSAWEPIQRIRPAEPSVDESVGIVELAVRKPGKVDGVCLAIDATLIDGVRITTLPEVQDSDDRPKHTFHPLREERTCGEGDVIELIQPDSPAGAFDVTSKVEVVPAPRVAERREARGAD